VGVLANFNRRRDDREDLTWEQVAEQLAEEYGVSTRTIQRWLGIARPPPHIRPRLMDDTEIALDADDAGNPPSGDADFFDK